MKGNTKPKVSQNELNVDSLPFLVGLVSFKLILEQRESFSTLWWTSMAFSVES